MRIASDTKQILIDQFKRADDKESAYFFCGTIFENDQHFQPYGVAFGKMNVQGELNWGKWTNIGVLPLKHRIQDFSLIKDTIFWALLTGDNDLLVIKSDTAGKVVDRFYYSLKPFVGLNELGVPIKIKYINEDEIYVIIAHRLLVRIRSSGSIVWSVNFITGNGQTSDAGAFDDILRNGNDLVVFGLYSKVFYRILDPYSFSGYFKMNLDPVTGRIINLSSNNIPKVLGQAGSWLYWDWQLLQIKTTNKGYSLSGTTSCSGYMPGYYSNNSAIKINLDSSFDILNVVQISPIDNFSPSFFTDMQVNSTNRSCIAIYDSKSSDTYYAFLDEKDSLVNVKQLKLNLYNNVFGTYLKGLVLGTSGKVTHLNILGDKDDKYGLVHLDGAWKSTEQDCIGKDTAYVKVETLPSEPYNFTWKQVETDVVQKKNIQGDVINDFTLQTEPLCKSISICDTIKLHAPSLNCSNDGSVKITA